jgi:hypothetical protein
MLRLTSLPPGNSCTVAARDSGVPDPDPLEGFGPAGLAPMSIQRSVTLEIFSRSSFSIR